MVAMIMEYGDTDTRVPSTPFHGVSTEFLSPHICSMLSPVCLLILQSQPQALTSYIYSQTLMLSVLTSYC